MAAAGAAGLAAIMPGASGAAEGAPAGNAGREFYELRRYRMRRGPMQARADAYFRDALIPALRRHGCGPVGVFNVMVGPENPTAHVLIPHPSFESVGTLPAKLEADAEYRKAAEPFLAAPPTDPAYVNLDIQISQAFPGMPRIEVPPGAAKSEPRIFELRTYRSHSEPANVKKIEMFDTAGEIAIFRRVGLTPVFFARTLIGPDMPNLIYLLTYPDLATREKNWNTFRADPEWKKLSTTPGLTDPEIVGGISNILLSPAAYSQV